MTKLTRGAVVAGKGVHYAWAICAGCVLLMFSITGLSINVSTIYLPYYISQNGFSYAQGSSMTMVRSCFSLLSVMLACQYYRWVSLKIGVCVACLLNTVSFIVFSVAHTLQIFYVASALAGLAHGFGSMIPISILIGRWFVDRRAFALSLCASGSGLATIVAPPVLNAIISRHGVAVSLYAEAVFAFCVMLVVFCVIIGGPDARRTSTYRCRDDEKKMDVPERFFVAKHLSLTGKERSAVAGALFLFGLVVTPGTSHLAVHFSTAGYAARWGTFAISLFGAALTAGQYIYGCLTDRIGIYRSNFLFLGLQCAGWLFLGLAHGGAVPYLVCGVTLIGVGLPTSAVGVSLWAADFSTMSAYDATVERYQVIFMAGGLIGAALPGIVADLTGGYGPVFILYAAFVLCTLLSLQCVYSRHR